MNVPIRKPWTQEQFFSWAEAQEARYEFDGFQPVAITGGNAGHSAIAINVQTALRNKLRGSGCRPLGPGAGVETVNHAVRYPDALVTCSRFENEDRVISGVIAVFEVLSPTSGRIDRILKVRDYAAVPSVRRYVILESTGIGVTVMERTEPNEAWRTRVLTNNDILRMPEIGIDVRSPSSTRTSPSRKKAKPPAEGSWRDPFRSGHRVRMAREFPDQRCAGPGRRLYLRCREAAGFTPEVHRDDQDRGDGYRVDPCARRVLAEPRRCRVYFSRHRLAAVRRRHLVQMGAGPRCGPSRSAPIRSSGTAQSHERCTQSRFRSADQSVWKQFDQRTVYRAATACGSRRFFRPIAASNRSTASVLYSHKS